MSERDGSTGNSDEEMRPLPDGGLSESLPEWLRRPPAWRNLPRREDPAGTLPDQKKSLPEPDTSVIDPRELITVEDLPQWLQDIAARETESTSEMAEDPVMEASTGYGREATSHPTSEPALEDRPPLSPFPAAPVTTQQWIWALRGTVILIILAIIFYVFVL